jgi:hypothetical protein
MPAAPYGIFAAYLGVIFFPNPYLEIISGGLGPGVKDREKNFCNVLLSGRHKIFSAFPAEILDTARRRLVRDWGIWKI